MIKEEQIIREKRRTLCIRIDDNANVKIFAPLKMPLKEIEKFILLKQSWIDKHKQKVLVEKQEFEDVLKLNKIIILGKSYHIKPTNSVKKCELIEDALFIPLKHDATIYAKIIKNFINERSNILLKKRLEEYAKIMKLKVNKFNLSNAKSKWGSCSKNGEIKLNWRLYLLDVKLIDYVIVHELCHLLQFNHSKLFYNLIETVIPNWRELRIELKKQSYVLNLFR